MLVGRAEAAVDQEYSRELWARETRSRALSTVMIANIALFTFYMLFREILVPHELFNPIYAFGLTVQVWRTGFHLKCKNFPDARWLKWNDRGIAVFGAFWFVFSAAVAVCAKSSDTNVNAFMVILLIGYLSSSSQFFAYSHRLYSAFVISVTIPGIWLASKFSEVGYQRVLLATLPLIYALVQMKTRRTLWAAMFRVSHAQNSLKSAIDSLPVGVTVIRSGTYEIVNAYYCRILGLPEREIIGQAVGFSRSKAESKEMIQQFLASGETVDSFEQTIDSGDGPREHFVLLRRAARDRNEIVMACLDIQELASAQHELEQERNVSQHSARIMALVAGEIGAPLVGLTEQVLVRQTPDLEKAREHLKKIQVAVNRMRTGS